MSKQEQTNLYIGSLITSIVGAAMLIFGNFAGWYNDGYYIEEWGDVYFTSGVVPFILIGSFAAALIYAATISYIGMSDPQKLSLEKVDLAFKAAIFATIGTLIGGIIFIIVASDNTDWWLDDAFFGGLIGGFLTTIILKKQKDDF